jgi:hypothetical protein
MIAAEKFEDATFVECEVKRGVAAAFDEQAGVFEMQPASGSP